MLRRETGSSIFGSETRRRKARESFAAQKASLLCKLKESEIAPLNGNKSSYMD